MSLSREQFIQRLEESSLMSTADIETFIDALPPDDKPQDGEQLARLLVQQKQLTAFQAQQIYAGKQQSLVLGNYTILDKLGQGGMGMVLKAEHRRMHRLVALKVLSPAATKTPGAVQRFHREVEAAAKLEHPNIVTAYDADESDGTHFLVMQYVAGKDLSVLVKKKGPLAVDKAVNCILQAARGLQYAHEQGVIHRDIKPANLLVDANGTVQILDMGLARLENSGGNADQAELTSTGQIMGTVDYMAPEQALNTKAADTRSDIYSLGITLWYLLTGRAAYGGDTLTAKLLAHQQSPIPSLISACSGASAELDAVFQKMVAKQPADRQQTMAAVVADLERCLTPTASAPSITSATSEDSKFQAFLSNLGSDVPPTIGTPEQTQASAEIEPTIDHTPTVSYDSSTEETNPQVNAELDSVTSSAAKAAKTSRLPINLRDRRLQIGAATATLLIVAGLIWGLTGNRSPDKPTETTTNGIPSIAVAPFDKNQATEYQQAWAKYLKLPKEKSVKLPSGATMAFMLIPPGEFTMGSTDDGSQGEDPSRRVKISEPFYLAKYELTQAEWLAVMGNNPSHFKGDLALPVETVRWEDSKALLSQLNTDISQDGMKFILPTEAQWEYACRAGTTKRWHFGDNEALLSEYGVFKNNSVGGTHAVGGRKPNPWGLYDMYGNVWEWCADWYAEFETEPNLQRDPVGPDSGERRVNRGGSYSTHAYSCRSAYRAHNPPTEAYGGIGFRLALTIESPNTEHNTSPTVPESTPLKAPPLAEAPFDAKAARQHQQAWAHFLEVDVEKEVELPTGGKMSFMLIPPGEFMMGSTADEQNRSRDEMIAAKINWGLNRIQTEGPRHHVRITQPFYLGKHEVTQSQWQAVMGNNPAMFSRDSSHPVERVSWENVQTFLTKMNRVLSGGQYQFVLPTEAQWEYSCRAGTTTRWHFGDNKSLLTQYAWFYKNSNKTTHPVGQLKPNGFGIFDMYGNVWEWCNDWHAPTYYSGAPTDDPSGPKSGIFRADRGGSFVEHPAYCRSATRNHCDPQARHWQLLGFRMAMTIDSPKLKSITSPTVQESAPTNSPTNHALEFNGISSVVSTPVKYDGKTPLTIETYIRRDPEIPKTGQTIISDVELGGFSIWYSMKEDELMLSVHDSKDYDHSAGPAPPAGQWVHVAGVIDGNTSRLYVDGKKILTGNLNGGVKPSPFKIVIGANPHPAGPVQVFAGIIDEVRISKSVRYTENFTPRPRFEPDAETIALYHFDEGDGDVAIDSSGNGHDAKITDANWVTANAQPIDNVDRKVAAQVLQVGGHLNLQILDEYDAARPLQVKQASELPTSPFVLRSIYLSNVKDIGNDQLFHLSKLRGLHELHLHNTNVTDIGLQHLRSITTLRNINLYGTQVNDAGLAHLAPLPQLVSISLSHTPAEQSGIAGLRSLHALRSILISNTISKERLIELASGNSIRELKFAGDAPQFTPAVVAEVHKTNPHCRIRALGGSVVGRDPVRELAEWVRQQGGRLTLDDVGNKRGRQEITAGQSLPDEIFSIRSIDFSRNDKIVDADLSRLTASIYLHELKLTGTKITDDGVGRLADCPTLGSIWLDDTQITDQSLKLLHQHFRLSSFYLHGTKVSGDGMKLLVGEPQVRWLSIGDSSIGADALTHISRMPKLQSLSLWRSDIGDEDIKQLASLRRLEKLDLSDTRVTKQGAAKLSKTLPRCTITYGPSGDKQVIEPTAAIDPDRAATLHVLQSGGTVLITARDESFTNREIKREADLPHIPFILHTVYFTNVKDITNEHLKPLAELKSLTQIGLQHTDITDDGLAHLSSIDSLYNLNLSYSRMTEAGLKHLANLPSLTNLAIAKSPIETSGLTGLSSLPILRWLTVSRDVSKERFLELARIDGLRELEFVGESAVITPAVVKEFHKVNPHCRIGRYNKEVVGRDPVRELAQWVQQQQGTLRLLLRNAGGVTHELTADQSLPTDHFHIIAIRIQENDKITDADLQRITVPAFLYEARFDGTNISDDGLKYLGDCPTLATIGLNDTHVAGKSLSQLSRLARLERLGLRGAPLTNDTIRELVTLKHVTRLAIGNDQITGEALTHLARMKQLQRLALSKTNIADDDLPKLAPLKNLNHLSLSDSKVTPAGAERLKKLLPACNITFGVIDDADIPEPAGNNKSSSQPTSSP